MGKNAIYNGRNSFREWQEDWALEERYNFRATECKWQKVWQGEPVYHAFLSLDYHTSDINQNRFLIAKDVLKRKKYMEGLSDTEDKFKTLPIQKNDIDIDEIVDSCGVDAFRLYTLFSSPFEQPLVYSEEALNGVYHFLHKVFSLFNNLTNALPDTASFRVMHQYILEINHRIEEKKFHTAVSSLMSYTGYLADLEQIPMEMYENLIKLMAPFTPHIADEMWARLGHTSFIINEVWPLGDEQIAKDEMVTMAIQINGKVRGTVRVVRDASQAQIIAAANTLKNVAKQLSAEKPQNIIVVPNRIMNIVLH